MPRDIVFQLHLVFRNTLPTMNINNNNNPNPLMQMRDRLFQVVFIRLSVSYSKLFPKLMRTFIENLMLLFAMMCLFILIYLHVTFIHSPMNCLDKVEDKWPHDGILRIEIIQDSDSDNYTLEKSYKKEARMRAVQGYSVSQYGEDMGFNNIPMSHYEPEDGVEDVETNNAASELFSYEVLLGKNRESFHSPVLNRSIIEKDSLEAKSRIPANSSTETESSYSVVWQKIVEILHQEDLVNELMIDVHIVEYSLEYGYLRLSPNARKHLKIPVELVTLDPSVDQCFGNWFTRSLMGNFLGYDDVLMASIRKLAGREENKGYMHNVVTDHYFRFVSLMNHVSYLFAAVIMLIFTLSISMLLRYSHHQIFIFIVQLLRLFELRVSTNIATAPLLTVILSLVGMEAIMSEFFSDPTTSFYVILIVWIADQYDSICCRTPITKRHWLRFFYLYHFAFYAYDYRFSGQYSDWALLTSCAFIMHSMVYFYHHFELPAILRAVAAHQQHMQQHHRRSSEPGPQNPGFDGSSPMGHQDGDQFGPQSDESRDINASPQGFSHDTSEMPDHSSEHANNEGTLETSTDSASNAAVTVDRLRQAPILLDSICPQHYLNVCQNNTLNASLYSSISTSSSQQSVLVSPIADDNNHYEIGHIPTTTVLVSHGENNNSHRRETGGNSTKNTVSFSSSNVTVTNDLSLNSSGFNADTVNRDCELTRRQFNVQCSLIQCANSTSFHELTRACDSGILGLHTNSSLICSF